MTKEFTFFTYYSNNIFVKSIYLKYHKSKQVNVVLHGCKKHFRKKGKCIRGKDTDQRNGYGLQKGSIKEYSDNLLRTAI